MAIACFSFSAFKLRTCKDLLNNLKKKYVRQSLVGFRYRAPMKEHRRYRGMRGRKRGCYFLRLGCILVCSPCRRSGFWWPVTSATDVNMSYTVHAHQSRYANLTPNHHRMACQLVCSIFYRCSITNLESYSAQKIHTIGMGSKPPALLRAQIWYARLTSMHWHMYVDTQPIHSFLIL